MTLFDSATRSMKSGTAVVMRRIRSTPPSPSSTFYHQSPSSTFYHQSPSSTFYPAPLSYCFSSPSMQQLPQRALCSRRNFSSPYASFSYIRFLAAAPSSVSFSKQFFSSSTPSSNLPDPSDLSSSAPYIALGAGVLGGLAGPLVGMGGAFVIIPLLTGVLKLSQQQAHGTSLVAVASIGATGALSFFLEGGQVDIFAAAVIAGAGMITAQLGAATTIKLESNVLKQMLGVFMMTMGILIPLKSYLSQQQKQQKQQLQQQQQQEQLPPSPQKSPVSTEESLFKGAKLVCVGLGTGFLAGLFGVGGGSFTVPAVTVICDLTHYCALGTSLAAMVFPAAAGVRMHAKLGHVVPRIAVPLALGSSAASFMGAKLAVAAPEEGLRWTFCAVMVVLGGRQFLGGRRAAQAALRLARESANSVKK